MEGSNIRFSTKYKTFEDWYAPWRELKRSTGYKYNQRIIKYVREHPEATLAEARGHKERESVKREREVNYRMTAAINGLPINNQWHNFSVTVITADPDSVDIEAKLFKYIKGQIGYAEDEYFPSWWNGKNYQVTLNIERPTPTTEKEGEFHDHILGEET